jgi:hypothetical protein
MQPGHGCGGIVGSPQAPRHPAPRFPQPLRQGRRHPPGSRSGGGDDREGVRHGGGCRRGERPHRLEQLLHRSLPLCRGPSRGAASSPRRGQVAGHVQRLYERRATLPSPRRHIANRHPRRRADHTLRLRKQQPLRDEPVLPGDAQQPARGRVEPLPHTKRGPDGAAPAGLPSAPGPLEQDRLPLVHASGSRDPTRRRSCGSPRRRWCGWLRRSVTSSGRRPCACWP